MNGKIISNFFHSAYHCSIGALQKSLSVRNSQRALILQFTDKSLKSSHMFKKCSAVLVVCLEMLRIFLLWWVMIFRSQSLAVSDIRHCDDHLALWKFETATFWVEHAIKWWTQNPLGLSIVILFCFLLSMCHPSPPPLKLLFQAPLSRNFNFK